MDANTSERRELLKSALVRIEQLEKRLAAAEQRARQPLAVIGLGCRFPGGANDPEALWTLLREGVDAVVDIPATRWNRDEFYDPDPDAPGKMYARGGGFVDDVDLFDPTFFGIAPREAPQMDPQQRLLLETAWSALEHAGIAPGSLSGSPTGVFIGLTTHDYARIQASTGGLEFIDTYFGTGVAGSVAAGRLSYVLGLRGPAVTIDTACSSSLVAIHLACQSLRNGETRQALAGGVNLILWPEGHVIASKGRMLAPDSRCKTFDSRADGYVRSEGCGLIVLKRLADALADGDPVLAVIRGTALNQDGRSSGMTAPNGRAQEDVMRQALADAGAAPGDVAYVETHGTGTSLGDPIEVQALGAVQGLGRPPGHPLLIGSIKTNIGHLEAAAGVAGVIKAVLALHHGELPPHLHFQKPNPLIPWATISVEVASERRAWPEGRPRLIGVSSFGFSGTNAHVVLDAAPAVDRPAPVPRPAPLFVLSGRTPGALRDAAARFVPVVEDAAPEQLADICFTAATGRTHFEHRLAIAGTSSSNFAEGLRAFVESRASDGLVSGEASLKRQPEVAFLFTGQGSQYANMGRSLYESAPVFRDALDRCDHLLRARLGRSLVLVLYPPAGQEREADTLLARTEWTQPALFSIEYALAQLWRSWGVEPSAVMGHSVGEYVAACVAGVFSLEDGLSLIAERARLMQALPSGGAMVAVPLPEAGVAQAIAALGGRVSIAAVNGPTQTVISGDAGAVDAVVERLGGAALKAQRLPVSHAFHSALIEPMLEAFERFASRLVYRPPQIPVISNVTGAAIDAPQTLDAAYWRQHARAAVRFGDSLDTARQLGCRVMLEVGPQPTLIGLAARSEQAGDTHWAGSLRKGHDDWRRLALATGSLYVAGVAIDWPAYAAGTGARRVQVPTYPFQRERFWIETPVRGEGKRPDRPGGHPLLGQPLTSPHLADAVFECDLQPESVAAVRDHRIFGRTVMPAAGFLEMASAAARAALGRPCAITDVAIREPLVFEGGARVIQTVVGRLSPHEVQIHSREGADESGSWVLHVSCRALPLDSPDAASSEPVEAGTAEASAVQPADYYARLAAAGVEYGPAFQGISSARRAPGWAEGEIVAPAVLGGELARFEIHPAVLDACFQLLGLALPPASEDTVYMPVQVGRYRAFRKAEGRMRVVARVAPESAAGAATFVGDLELRGADHGLIASIGQLRFKKASQSALQRAMRGGNEKWFHAIEWQPIGAAREAEAGAAAGRWIILADTGGCGAALAHALTQQGGRPTLVFRGDRFARTGDDYHLHPLNPGDFDALVGGVLNEGPLAGVVHLWNLDVLAGGPVDASALDEARATGVVSLLHLAQTLSRAASTASLTIVTRGAQAVGASHVSSESGVAQGAAWGLGRVIATEQAGLRAVLVDLDPTVAAADQAGEVLRQALEPSREEDQVALRDAARFGARLVRTSQARPGGLPLPATDFTVAIRDRGVLENLELQAIDVPPPAPREIRIRVEASGLNFRDVLSALGMYPGEPGPLGGEAVGVVETVGAGVTRFAVGDPVLALTPRGFTSVVNTSEKLAWRRPEGMSVTAAATVPIVFLTAHYALNHLAGMARGERVLIHAGTGGVGLAAIQLAQMAGAEVFATAGSAEKRDLLCRLGVAHVMDSRSLDFADEIHRLTGGEGIDIVLNSLAGEFIARSLPLLREGGRFLELGKTDLWSAGRAADTNPRASYIPVYLGEACGSQPDLVQKMFGEVMGWLENGPLTALPWRAFSIDRVHGAFRFMAQARHIGKIVIEQTSTSDRVLVRPDATYLVTGAFGGLGLAIVRWLVAAGARHLALVGRRAPAGEALKAIEALPPTVSVRTILADVADLPALQRAVEVIDAGAAPLRGIVHAAGIVEDGLLMQQDAAMFERVMRPKVQGAWNLHRLVGDRDLDFMALFSAGAALLGSPGQGNYAAANAFMDALASFRRSKDLRTVAINWGPWRDVGMAAALSSRDRERWAAMGIDEIAPDRGLAAFEQALRRDVEHVAILPIEWPRFLSQFPGPPPALLRALADANGKRSSSLRARTAGEVEDVAAALAAAPVEERRGMLERHVREQVARVLGIAAATLPADRDFAEIGMDSLMSVELSNRLRGTLRKSLSSTIAFEQPTIAALTDYLACEVEGVLGAERPVGVSTAADPGSVLARLDELSDRDVDALLGAILTEAEERQ